MDSSDEEWATAYAAMDPISQLGWRNRRGSIEGPAEQLMRDVLQAADVVHSDAMSEMGESGTNNDEWPEQAEDSNAGSLPHGMGASRSPTVSIEVDQEGGAPVQKSKSASICAWKLTCVRGQS